MSGEQRCGTCRFHVQSWADCADGQCRKSIAWTWRNTEHTDWCGEWAAKAGADEAERCTGFVPMSQAHVGQCQLQAGHDGPCKRHGREGYATPPAAVGQEG